MYSKRVHRCLSFLLALAMVLSLVPFPAHAEEMTDEPAIASANTTSEINAETENTSVEETEKTEADQLIQVQAGFDAILMRYLGTTSMTAEEIADTVAYMEWEKIEAALADFAALEPAVTALSNDELAYLEENYEGADTLVCFYETLQLTMTPSVFASTSGTHTPVTNVTVTVSGATDNSMTNGAITVTAKGSAGFFGFGASDKTTTITVKNASSTDAATVSFSWTATSVNQLTIDGAVYTGTSGSFSKGLDAGGSFNITIVTGKNGNTNTLVMSGFSWVSAAAVASLTVVYDGTMGTVTADGVGIDPDDPYTMTGGKAELVAAAKSGYTFVGWANTSNNLITTDTKYTVSSETNISVKAIFASKAWFLVNETNTLYEDLGEAAGSTGAKTVILMNSGTLPAGDYTIPSGVTLLIPHDDAGTVVTNKPPVITSTQSVKVFRTLTMASGANIILKGTMSIAASLTASQTMGYNGLPTGNVAQVNMNENSSITLESGSVMYAMGFIYGSGSVEVKSGGTVYECFQLRDFRGGSATSTIVGDSGDKRLFPMMQYYIQNVQVPMTLNAGAIEIGISSFYVTLVGITYSEVPFIGNSSMFNITSGYIIKDYDENTDRLIIEAHGDLEVNNYTFSITINVVQSVEIESADYFLPINHNITVDVQSGSLEINQDINLLPGAELKIQEGATCILGSGTEIVLYDADNWGAYCGEKYTETETNTTLKPLLYIAGGTIHNRRNDTMQDASVLINGTLDATNGNIYTTDAGANIYSTSKGQLIGFNAGSLSTVYQATQDETNITYHEITVTPAKLKNEDGSFVDTSVAATATTYNHDHYTCEHETTTEKVTHGVWYAGEHDYTASAKVTVPTYTEVGYTTYSCSCASHSYDEDLYAAKVGETPYKILSEAISAASESSAVTLQANIGGTVTVSKAVTINKDGHSAEITAGSGYALVEENDIVTVWALISLSGTSVTAGDSLDIYFYVYAALLGDGEYYAEISRTKLVKDSSNTYSVSQTVSETIRSTEWQSYGDYLRFCYDGIAAKEMTDSVSVTIYDENGRQFSSTATESIEGYALRSLVKHNDTVLHTALVDMLNYGAAAQTYFGYKADDLANADLTEDQKTLATKESTPENNTTSSGETYKLKGATVTAESDLYFTFYFSGITEGTKANFSADIAYTDHNGKQHSQTISGTAFSSYGDYYGPCVTGLAVADGSALITCTLKKDGETVTTATSSVESYIAATISENKDKADLVALCDMLMKFVDSAYNYFWQRSVSG